MRAWLRGRSIRFKLLGVIAAVTLLAIASFGSLALVLEHRTARAALESEQAALASLVANRSAAALLFGDSSLGSENLEALGSIPHVQSACLYDVEGRLFAAHSIDRAPPCASTRTPSASGDAITTDVDVVLDEVLGSLVIRSSLAPVRDRLSQQALTWGAAASFCALLAVLLTLLLEPRISGPIRRLSALVDSIEVGGVEGRRAYVEGRDEVGQLAAAFNRMLDRLDEQARSLRLQAEYNEVIFQRSPLPVIVIDPQNDQIIDCNDAAVALYGRGSLEATLAIDASAVSTPTQYDGSPSAEAAAARVQAALAGAPQVYEWRHRRPDGSEFDAEVHLLRFGPDDAPLLLGSIVDITERKAAAVALQRMNDALETRVAERTADLARSNAELSAAIERLQRAQGELVRSERLASLGALVAGVAHELNTPLGSVLLVATTLGDSIETLRDQLERGELKRSSLADFLAQQAEAQSLIVRNARRAAELIGRFKQVAVDQTSEHRRRFELAGFVDEVMGTLLPRLKATPYRLELAIPPAITLDSYPGPLGQVLTNLVMNAMLHGLGERAGSIHVTARALDDDRVELCVADDGVGIPPEHLPHIFDPFFTTKLGEGGSGLGLHIVYSLVQRTLGGTIAVDSTPGHGARFIVTLPRTAPRPSGG